MEDMKRQPMWRRKISIMHVADDRLSSRIYGELLQNIIKKIMP